MMRTPLLAVLLIAVPFLAVCQTQRRNVGASQSSVKDKPLIAFADNLADHPSPDPGRAQIFSVELDGSNRKQLTFSTGGNFFPVWSPDGQRLAFISTRTGSPEIWVMDADGMNQKEITSGGGNFIPAWSPDGRQIAFTSTRTGSPQIWVMNADGSKPRQLTTAGHNNVPVWSPDGQKIAFWSGDETGFGQVWVMDADGGNRKQLTFAKIISYTPKGSSANAPSWLYSQKIAYWSGIEHQYGQVWVMNADGSNQQQLTTEPAPISSDNPVWSPDGTKILFDTNRNRKVEIWVMDANGQNQRVLISDIKLIPARASWRSVRRN